jgi:hypothetical protein
MFNTYKSQFIAGGLSALLLTGAALSAFAATQVTAPPSVVVLNQKLEAGNVLVEYAYLPQKGYAVVYGADKDGKPIKEPLGHLELEAGDHRKFKIKLNTPPPAGTKIWVSLYTDNDGKPGFDRSGDKSVWNDQLPSENQIVIQ